MGIYASQSNVSVEKSKAEIERILTRYGATHFSYSTDYRKVVLGFIYNGLAIKLDLPLPDPDDFKNTPTGRRRRNNDDALKAWEQACRSSWRSLCLIILAKLDATKRGIASFEKEFLAYIYLPETRQTVGEEILPQISNALEGGRMGRLLLPGLIEAKL